MKLGMGHSYDDVEYLPVKIRAYIELTKPASSVGAGMGALLGSIFYFAYVEGGGSLSQIPLEISSIIYVSLTIFLAHSASQAMNMAEDAEIDKDTPHKQNRPIPSGVVEEEEARALSWVLVFISLSFAYLLNWRFGVFASILIFMGIFYNLDPIRAKERVISVPWQAVSRGLLSFPMLWAAFGDPLAIEAWILGLFMFFYVLGFQNSADIIDKEIDAKYGIQTWVVEFGVKKTVLIAFGCTMLMVSVIALSTSLGILEDRFLAMILIVPFCLYMLQQMWVHPYKVSETTGNHPAWLHYYMGMVLCVVIPLFTEVSYKLM